MFGIFKNEPKKFGSRKMIPLHKEHEDNLQDKGIRWDSSWPGGWDERGNGIKTLLYSKKMNFHKDL